MNGVILYKDISEKIIEDISSGSYAIGKSLPSHEELCKKYNVSLVTIKKALKRCEELGYIECKRGRKARVSIQAGEKSKRDRKVLILDVATNERLNREVLMSKPTIKSPVCDEWHSQIKKGIIESIPKDYDVICAAYYQDDIINNYESTLIPEVDKVVIIVGSSAKIVSFLQSKGKKVATFNGDPDIKCCCVINDEFSVSRSAVDHLISLGHKRIAFLGVCGTVGDFYSRQRGYQQALIDAGLSIDGQLIRLSKHSSADVGYNYMNDILNTSFAFGLPTAVFCGDDVIAYGALKAIEDNYFKCPDDISVIGVNNYKEICHYSDPPLSSIEKNFKLIGEKFVEVLTRKIWVDDTNVVPCNIVIRKSIKKIK